MTICPTCNGSGEGQYDGAICRDCGGTGEVLVDDGEWEKADEDYQRMKEEG